MMRLSEGAVVNSSFSVANRAGVSLLGHIRICDSVSGLIKGGTANERISNDYKT